MNKSTNSCRPYQELIEGQMADEISVAQRAELEEHCATCPACESLMALHGKLLALADEIPHPDEARLREMRESVLAMTASRAGAASGARTDTPSGAGFLIDLARLWQSHPLPAGLATAAVLLCAVLLGRWSPREASLEDQLVRDSRQWTANASSDLQRIWDSPYSFQNVTVRGEDAGKLSLSFVASRHVEMEVAKDSPLAREVLLHAILDPTSLGERLGAMNASTQIQDDRLQEALVLTMLGDPDPTARINALSVLTRYPYDARIQEAYLQSLRQDPDVEIRLKVLDELARHQVDPKTIRNAVGEDDPQGTMPLLRQATFTY